MKSAFVMMASVIGVAVAAAVIAGRARDGQRAPCANFDGPGRIPYCGGKPGVYAIIDAVTFEPAVGAAERIRISGTFIVPRPVSSGLHMAPQRGYLYFSLVSGSESAGKKDWSELAAAAGSGQVVGFSEYWVSRPDPNHRLSTMNTSLVVQVHNEEDKSGPEPYPLPHEKGVIKAFDSPSDLNPRFGEPSAVLISELRDAVRR